MNGARITIFFLATPPGEGSKGQISIKFQLQSISKIFIPNFVCVLTNKIQIISDRIFILSPGSCPRGRTLGVLRGPNQIPS